MKQSIDAYGKKRSWDSFGSGIGHPDLEGTPAYLGQYAIGHAYGGIRNKRGKAKSLTGKLFVDKEKSVYLSPLGVLFLLAEIESEELTSD